MAFASNNRTSQAGASTQLTINVKNTNDNRPNIFVESPIVMLESANVGFVIGNVFANDTDGFNSGKSFGFIDKDRSFLIIET